MTSTKLRKRLLEIRHTTPFAKAKVYQLSNSLIGNVAIRYQLLKSLDEWITQNGGFNTFTKVPTPDEWLLLAPIWIRGGSKNSATQTNPESLVTLAFEKAESMVKLGLTSIVHVSRLFKMASICRLIDVPDPRDIEFIKAIPRASEKPMRAFTDGDFTVYFIDERFVILVNRHTGLVDGVDDNYFISVYDFGGVLPYITAGKIAMPELTASSAVCMIDRLPITRLGSHTNKNLVLWKMVTDPVQYYWFVDSDLHQRNPLYTITYRRAVIPNHAGGIGIPAEDWENLVREFGIPSLNKLRRMKDDETKMSTAR